MSQIVLNVTCPPGCGPGQMLALSVPDGRQVQVQVPANVGPGMTFQVAVPAAVQALDPIESMFNGVDADRSGHIDANELQRALNAGAANFSVEGTRKLMLQYDDDRSGTITRAEFRKLYQGLQEWRRAFDAFDTDRSGHIDLGELKTALQKMGYGLSNKLTDYLWKIYDKDNSNSIGFDEFIQVCTELQILTQHFASYDTSGSGQVGAGSTRLHACCSFAG